MQPLEASNGGGIKVARMVSVPGVPDGSSVGPVRPMSLPQVDDDLGVVVDLGVGVEEDWEPLNMMEDASVPRVT